VAAVAFELPWPPSLNHYYRHVGPRVLVSRTGRRYREGAVARLRGLLPKPLDGPVRLVAEFYPPDFRRRDADNLLKIVQDCFTSAGLYHDDSQIAELHVFKREPVPPDGLAHFELGPA
jgi:Holliday junction resolvase RusA-like endonuclease